ARATCAARRAEADRLRPAGLLAPTSPRPRAAPKPPAPPRRRQVPPPERTSFPYQARTTPRPCDQEAAQNAVRCTAPARDQTCPYPTSPPDRTPRKSRRADPQRCRCRCPTPQSAAYRLDAGTPPEPYRDRYT